MRIAIRGLLLFLACLSGYAIARADRVDPVVVSREPIALLPSARATRGSTAGQALGASGAPCLQPAPGPNLTCQDGEWLPPADPPSGGGGPWRASGCLTPPPAEAFRCQEGVWMMAGSGGTGNASPTGAPAAPSPADPAAPLDPARADPSGRPTPVGTAPAGGCAGPMPVTTTGSSVTCVNGAWVIR